MRIGILGAGSIAATMATTMQSLKETECYAVAARDKRRAQAFADKYGFQFAYGSYADMLSDPYVELVYIATPHSFHYEHIKMCLEHGKHVICEKAFTANAKQAEEVFRMAEERGLLLTEAIWTRYMPMRTIIDDIVKSGIIGHPTSLSANLGYPLEHKERLVKPELCGGALLDLGVYVLNFASMVFGNSIEGIAATCVKYESGVDAQETIMLSYSDGKMASLYATMLAQTDRRGLINGTNGYIEIENINNPETIHVYNLDRKVIAEYAAPCQVTGYEYEMLSAINAIQSGQLECPEMPHSESIFMMQLMDSIRSAWNIKFPFDVEATTEEKEIAEMEEIEKILAEEKAKAEKSDSDDDVKEVSDSEKSAAKSKDSAPERSAKIIAQQNFKTSVSKEASVIGNSQGLDITTPSPIDEIEINEIKMSPEQERMQKKALENKKQTNANPGTAVSMAIHKAAENAEKPDGEAIPIIQDPVPEQTQSRFVFGMDDIPPMPERLKDLVAAGNPNGAYDDDYEDEVSEELDDSKFKFSTLKDEPYKDELDPKKTAYSIRVNENYRRPKPDEEADAESDGSSEKKNSKSSKKKLSPFKKLTSLFSLDDYDDYIMPMARDEKYYDDEFFDDEDDDYYDDEE